MIKFRPKDARFLKRRKLLRAGLYAEPDRDRRRQISDAPAVIARENVRLVLVGQARPRSGERLNRCCG